MRQSRWVCAMVGVIAFIGVRQACAADNDRILVSEATILAPIQEVWDSFFDEQGREWMTPSCSIDLRIGGLIKSSYIPDADLDGEHAIHHEILAIEPGRRLISRLVKGPADFPHTKAIRGMVGIMEFDPIGPEATSARAVMLGFPETPGGDAAIEFFRMGNAQTFDGAKAHLERADQAQRTARAMGLLRSLIGGEWIHEGEMPDGRTLRVRNVVHPGPNTDSVLANGWLGFGEEGMFDHGPTLVWLDPEGVIRFSSVHEHGVEGTGTIRLLGNTPASDTIEWDWWATEPDGAKHHYAVTSVIPGGDSYTSAFAIYDPDGVTAPASAPMGFHRYETAPELFRTLINGEVIASGDTMTSEHPGMDHGTRIEVSEIIPASAEEVWDSWTTSAGVGAFLGVPADIELRRGGKFEIYFDEDGEPGSRGSETCEVLGYIPGRMLSFTWNAPPKFTNCRFLHTWVVVELRPIGEDRTEVTITHEGWDENMAAHPQFKDEWEGVHAYFQNAWPYVMNALKAHHEKN